MRGGDSAVDSYLDDSKSLPPKPMIALIRYDGLYTSAPRSSTSTAPSLALRRRIFAPEGGRRVAIRSEAVVFWPVIAHWEDILQRVPGR